MSWMQRLRHSETEGKERETGRENISALCVY